MVSAGQQLEGITTTKSGRLSAIAAGLFTDGGTVNIFSSKPEIRLGAGTLGWHDMHTAGKIRLNKATCLLTVTGRGTFRLTHGTGRYTGITGSGRFSAIGRTVYPRKANGTCASSRPLAFQGIITLTRSVTER